VSCVEVAKETDLLLESQIAREFFKGGAFRAVADDRDVNL